MSCVAILVGLEMYSSFENAADVVFLAPSDCDLQLSLESFAECEAARTKISTYKS